MTDSPLRVAMDITSAVTGRTGIAVYINSLLAALAERGIDVRPFAVGRVTDGVPPGCQHLRVPSRIVHRAWQLGLPPRPERMVGGADVVHATGLLTPTSRCPIVATVHDLAPLEHPELHPARAVDQATQLLRSLRRAAAVIADSQSTADSIAERGYPMERITVVHPGVAGLGPPAPGPVVDRPYVLAVGEQHRRKGLDTLLRAVARMPDVTLVHAGPRSEATEELELLATSLGLGSRWQPMGFVDAPTLAALYRDARCLAYPSISEGFGFPVLEAMGAGTPVVASDIPPVREVSGGHAVLTPVGDVDAWHAALTSVLADEQRADELRRGGRRRAATFRWSRCAEATIAVYQSARAAGPPPRSRSTTDRIAR